VDGAEIETAASGERGDRGSGEQRRSFMEEHECGLRVGQSVPDLKIETFDPVKADFGEIDLAAVGKAGKWTVLFFYPADFTFV
jgi:hypothetical protein